MASFTIKCSKNKAQTVITVKQTDSLDLSAATVITINVYTDSLTADSAYAFDSAEIADFVADGEIDLLVSDLGLTGDDFYLLEMITDLHTSVKAGIAITLEATGEVYSHQGYVDIYSPDFRVDRVLHTAHMLLQEMNTIETMSASLQKRVDFTSRLSLIKKILQYT